MTARPLSPEEKNRLLETMGELERQAHRGEDKDFFSNLAEKLDGLLVVCKHQRLAHKRGLPTEQVLVADFCPDCLSDYDCEGHSE